MASVIFRTPARQNVSIPIYSDQSFDCPAHYGPYFQKRYTNAIVPDHVQVQHVTSPVKGRVSLLHCYLPVDVNLSSVHRVIWQVRYADHCPELSALSLEAFVGMTCLYYQKKTAEARIEEKVCDILFPGMWALLPYQKHIVLWYRQKVLLPFEHGMILCQDSNIRNFTQRYAAART